MIAASMSAMPISLLTAGRGSRGACKRSAEGVAVFWDESVEAGQIEET